MLRKHHRNPLHTHPQWPSEVQGFPTYSNVEGDLVPWAHTVGAHLVPAVVGQGHQAVCGGVVQDLAIVIGWLEGEGEGNMVERTTVRKSDCRVEDATRFRLCMCECVRMCPCVYACVCQTSLILFWLVTQMTGLRMTPRHSSPCTTYGSDSKVRQAHHRPKEQSVTRRQTHKCSEGSERK